MEILEGVKIHYVVFRANDGEFAIVRGYYQGQEICLTGGLYPVDEGTTIDAVGDWTKHPKYGVQFSTHSYIECRPTDVVGIENYLKSNMLLGIGPATASAIVSRFKEATFDILDTDPDKLSEIPGLGPERISQIKYAWGQQKNMRETVLFLSAYGLSMTLILRIYKRYGEESIQKIQENPYCLADEIEGIGFQIADAIALAMGVDRNSYQRCRCGTLYYLSTIGQNGHCFTTHMEVLRGVCKLLTLPPNLIDRAMQHMAKAGDIIIEAGVRVYPKMYYDYENEVAQDIKRLMNAPREGVVRPLDSHDSPVKYTDNQLETVNGSVEHKFMVITGEPGSGKTTVTKAIVDTFVASYQKVLLASPTGRAAKVLSESTDREAMTIHRLLEYNPSTGYGFNADNTLDGDVLILDEVSMVAVILMRHLLKALPDHMVVILVGDADQIPSVGPGNVIGDIIASGVVPVYKLTQVFRQDEGSSIKLAAHNINKGALPDLSNPAGADFFFIPQLDESKVAEMIVKLRAESLPKKRGVNAINDIHVVAPMYKGEAGVTNLNLMLQKALNHNIGGVRYLNTEFRVGDKVIQTRNDYEKDVYNGSVGIVVSVDLESNSIQVDFGFHEPIEYSSLELGDLELGYITTIHKAQGSEYPIVLIPLVHTHTNWYRKLLYTAITRAKMMVVLIGSENVLRAAIANIKAVERNTRLWERLRAA